MRHVLRLIALPAVLVLACSAPVATNTPAPVPTPVVTVSTPAPPDDSGWQTLAGGVELRQLRVQDAQGAAERLWLVRLDADAQARLAVAYDPDEPRRVSGWAQATGAPLVINAGYFTDDYRATGLLVSDGTAYGTSFEGAGGMLAVIAGHAQVRWLAEQPVLPGEVFEQAVQGWPMLVGSGVPLYTEPDTRVARRTVAAQDRAGHVVFVVSPGTFFTLHDLAAWLAASDLDLAVAVNLDGGQSTGLWIAQDGVQVDSFGKVPAVIVLRE